MPRLILLVKTAETTVNVAVVKTAVGRPVTNNVAAVVKTAVVKTVAKTVAKDVPVLVAENSSTTF